MAGRVNWPQAFAEVGLLSLGVVVALAGQAWMEERNERVEEREYLVALQRDFEETLVESQEYIHINESRLASVIALMEVTAPSELAGVPPTVSTHSCLRASGSGSTTRRSRPTRTW